MHLDPFMQYFVTERRSIVQDIYRGDVLYKSYPRFPQVVLPRPKDLGATLEYALKNRISTRNFNEKTPLTLEDLSAFLKLSAGSRPDSTDTGDIRRTYPSGGAKFPIELYLVVSNIKDLENGLYHYNVERHALEKLINSDFEKAHKRISSHYVLARNSAVTLLFSMIKSRSMGKYGGFAYKLMLLEAGHISQNVYLSTTALGLGCCGMGIIDPRPLNEMLSLDGVNESIIYGMSIGKPFPKKD